MLMHGSYFQGHLWVQEVFCFKIEMVVVTVSQNCIPFYKCVLHIVSSNHIELNFHHPPTSNNVQRRHLTGKD